MPHSLTDKAALRKERVSHILLHNLFFELSELLGYSPEYIQENYLDNLETLIESWREQGFIEIYEEPEDRAYLRAKPSSLSPNSSPYYIGVYHARVVDGENDPLVTIVFEKTDIEGQTVKVASIRFMVDHDSMFGHRKDKWDPSKMKIVRRRIGDLLNKGGVPLDL